MARSATSRISERGQTTIPLEIRKSLNLSEGDLICYEIEGKSSVKIHKLEQLDMEWARAIENTLAEWQGDEDDDL
jgi:antitoxin PrlF